MTIGDHIFRLDVRYPPGAGQPEWRWVCICGRVGEWHAARDAAIRDGELHLNGQP